MKKILILIFVLIAFVAGYYFYNKNTNKEDVLIYIENPKEGEYISSPVSVSGKARGYYFFEGSFPVNIVNWDGLIVGEGYVTAKDEWMTTDYVDFEGEITFEKPQYKDNGWIIFKRDNPSGMPENDYALELPIYFK